LIQLLTTIQFSTSVEEPIKFNAGHSMTKFPAVD